MIPLVQILRELNCDWNGGIYEEPPAGLLPPPNLEDFQKAVRHTIGCTKHHVTSAQPLIESGTAP